MISLNADDARDLEFIIAMRWEVREKLRLERK